MPPLFSVTTRVFATGSPMCDRSWRGRRSAVGASCWSGRLRWTAGTKTAFTMRPTSTRQRTSTATCRTCSRLSGPADHGGGHAGMGAGGERLAGGPRRREHRLKRRLEDKPLATPSRRGPRVPAAAAGARGLRSPKPVRESPAIPDRRQLRHDRWHRRDVASVHQPATDASPCSAEGVAKRFGQRPLRRGGCEVDLEWKDGSLARCQIVAPPHATLSVRYGGKKIDLDSDKRFVVISSHRSS